MDYDFDEMVERRGSHAYKWDASDDPDMLPMWVADMDFRTAPAVIAALERRARHGVFGYAKVPDAYFDAVTGWFARRHGFRFEREGLLYTTGVVPALSAIIQALCQPGNGVLVQPPAYNCFFSSIRNSGCRLVANPLHRDAQGRYAIDFEDLERKAADPGTTLMLLCNPHNPVGRAWTTEELERVGRICLAHGVTVVSDEIHCDLAMPGHVHIPFGSLGASFLQASVTCTSPSKAFNLAGLQAANILAADPDMRRRIDKQININEVCEISPFAVEGMIAAYNEGEAWLDRLRAYLAGNAAALRDWLAEHLPWLHVTPLEATYLAWVDCSAVPLPSATLARQLRERQHLWISEGTLYGPEGEGFLRINLACPRARLMEGLRRLESAFALDGSLAM